MKYVVTHGAKAHRDDFYAVGLAAYLFGILQVFRREPTLAELEDPEILVIDVGGRHEPEKSNFDHHQFPRGTEECALSLMAKHYKVPGMKESFYDLWNDAPWYVGVVMQDALGLPGFAQWLEIGKTMPEELISGIEVYCLQRFAGIDRVSEEWIVFAREMITMKTITAIEFRAAMEKIAQNHTVRKVEGVGSIFWAPTLSPFGLHNFIQREGLDICMTVTEDPRSKGLCLYRLDERMDLSRLEGPEVLFAHKAGFMATLKPGTSWERVEELIRAAAQKG